MSGIIVLAGGEQGYNENSYLRCGNKLLLEHIVDELDQMQMPVVVSTDPHVYQNNIGDNTNKSHIYVVKGGRKLTRSVTNGLMRLIDINLGNCDANFVYDDIPIDVKKMQAQKDRIREQNLDDRVIISVGDTIAPYQLYQGILETYLAIERIRGKRVDAMMFYLAKTDIEKYFSQNGAEGYMLGGKNGVGFSFSDGNLDFNNANAKSKFFFNLSGNKYALTEKFVPAGVIVLRLGEILNHPALMFMGYLDTAYEMRHLTEEDSKNTSKRALEMIAGTWHNKSLFFKALLVMPLALISYKLASQGRNGEEKLYPEWKIKKKISRANLIYGPLSYTLGIDIVATILPPQFALLTVDVDAYKREEKQEWLTRHLPRLYESTIPKVTHFMASL